MVYQRRETGVKYVLSRTLTGRAYLSFQNRPSPAEVQLATSRWAPTFPFLELLLGCDSAVRECILTVTDTDGHILRYTAFYTEDSDLSQNPSILYVDSGCSWKGSIILMRVGRSNNLVNFRRADRRNADAIIQQ
ncbi:hypothetical protein SISNIDRAFT_491937 [Sistotremastrum niveocremeum HHB9708]|uniref:Uncharacterized protein n=1 Tax=Sistotremastrum niveocremeum HHB9708 TaxID=1314777 RepID=A0A164M888_9AGAM|nr:hypothetical protein SISNIDRAFT_491937 [Sistotremastrum niveocremeum HHB9708]